ncbi:thiolase-like protein [Ascobolus immersus RN42]|uniref:Thiolase-like protein n=1 Tax=Ascobolus immersus RN42 TaxID=1160509 RepID=A0A3N4IBC5_ASCIM|nr:thiolase-like protein [Ascobolus immersus RN42]
MQVLSVRTALPEHRYTQAEITAWFVDTMLRGKVKPSVVEKFHVNSGIDTRHLALPMQAYDALTDFGAANDAFIAAGVKLGARAVTDALKAAGLTPTDVDMIISVTVTGPAVPSLDARVASLIGLREDVVRVPIVGLDCVAGAAGLARLYDYLLGHPNAIAVLMSIELCSLTLQRNDASVPNILAGGLFGDGAAAVVATGGVRASQLAPVGPPHPEVLAAYSRLYPDSGRAIAWDVGASGFKVVLGNTVPGLVLRYLGPDVDRFLTEHGLSRTDIEWYVVHPGGPKVLEAVQAALKVDRSALEMSWESLRCVGNLSSASALHVLERTLMKKPPGPGSLGLMLAMGPGFCSELVLLRMPALNAQVSLQECSAQVASKAEKYARRGRQIQARRRAKGSDAALSIQRRKPKASRHVHTIGMSKKIQKTDRKSVMTRLSRIGFELNGASIYA